MEEESTTIDRNILKVLTVDTRADILKELKNGKRTLFGLSRTLKKISQQYWNIWTSY